MTVTDTQKHVSEMLQLFTNWIRGLPAFFFFENVKLQTFSTFDCILSVFSLSNLVYKILGQIIINSLKVKDSNIYANNSS